MKTSTIPPSAPRWLLIDADGKNLGRIAARVSMILRGKHRATFSPHQISGDHVVIINAGKIAFPASKLRRKTYYRHSGYLGHLKATPLEKMLADKPAKVMEKAVYGMLPINRLRAKAMQRLHVFAAAEHTHTAQKPVPLPL